MSSPSTAAGRIIFGLRPDDVQAFIRTPETEADDVEGRYMRQVRERARQKAKDVLIQALNEAEHIRQQAHDEAFAAGLEKGHAEGLEKGRAQGREESEGQIQQETEKLAALVSSLQTALDTEKECAYDDHKVTLFRILRLAVEKTLGRVLEETRLEVLNALFEDALQRLQTKTVVTVHVCPSDVDDVREMIERVKNEHSDIPEVRLQGRPDLAPGSIRVESGDGLVDNSIMARLEQVTTILDKYLEHA